MREEFVQYLWRFQLFNHENLLTHNGLQLNILHAGFINEDAGPDFKDAKIEIDGILWVGSVEIHLEGRNWLDHKHDKDKNYDGTILHVCWEKCQNISRLDGTNIPCIELKNRTNLNKIELYKNLNNNINNIPCSNTIFKSIFTLDVQFFLTGLAIERIHSKSLVLNELIKRCNNNFLKASFIFILQYFGSPINQLPLEELGRSLEFKILLANRDSLLKLESLILGQAGLLFSPTDAYSKELKTEYNHLQRKYSLQPIDSNHWKFSRMRPYSFPDFKLAQLAAIIYYYPDIMSIIDGQLPNVLIEKIQPSEYWKNHFRLGKQSSKSHSASITKTFWDKLMINAVLPAYYYFGQMNKDENIKENAYYELEKIAAENNKITKPFADLGFANQNAAQSQSIIHLFKNYCSNKKCLECKIGQKILNQ